MSFHNKYTSLTLNGEFFNKAQLKHLILANDSASDWEKSLYQFIEEWLNDKPFIIVKTSGSTGTPKSILLLKERMVASAKMTGTYFSFRKGQKALLCLPCHYIAGKMMVVRAFVWQLDLRVSTPDSNPIIGLKEGIDFAAMIPFQVTTILAKNPKQLSFIKQLIIGGAKVDNLLLEQLQHISTHCYATYGMTETITHIAIKRLNGMQRQSFYQALPSVVLKQDDRGCLVIEAPHLSVEPIITNDVVKLEDTQRFIWLGRIDNVINTGGIKVYPEQIEQKLELYIKRRFFISALPDEKLGDKVVLLIEGEAINDIKITDLHTIMNKRLSKYEVPKSIFFIKNFEETQTGKIQRDRTKNKLLH